MSTFLPVIIFQLPSANRSSLVFGLIGSVVFGINVCYLHFFYLYVYMNIYIYDYEGSKLSLPNFTFSFRPSSPFPYYHE